MIGLTWNCRGLGSPRAENALKGVVRVERPHFVFLSETKLKGREWETLKRKLNFKNFLGVDCRGEGRHRRGGLAMFWSDEINLTLLSCSLNHMDFRVDEGDGSRWRLTGVYGHPEEENKHQTWTLMKSLSREGSLPWLCFGDFNCIAAHEEKRGGPLKNQREIDGFREALRACHLNSVWFEGHPFTWSNNRVDRDNTQERLDRVLMNDAWHEMFPRSKTEHLPKRRSDHLPIKIVIQRNAPVASGSHKRRRGFKFEKEWLRDEECQSIVNEAWQFIPSNSVNGKIAMCANKLKGWSMKRPNDFKREIEKRRVVMRELVTCVPTVHIVDEMKRMDAEIDELEQREEVHWAQRSRQNWLRDGDQNTAFFHRKASQRRSRNTIKGVMDDGGVWKADEEEAKGIFLEYFQALFTTNGENDEMQQVLATVKPKVTTQMNADMGAPYTREEVIETLKQMHPTKAPGPDGMPALFYKTFWYVIGEDVLNYVLDILNNDGSLDEINHTHIVLIPKKKECESTKDYRPISLCNVLYKLVSKTISNRLKKILPCIISECQSAFVPGRLITDNVLVAYELFHYLRKKKVGVKGYMAMKLDMSKAYDRVEWKFVTAMMEKLGFDAKVCELVFRCISSVSYSLLFNGFPTRSFVPSRGLRQGDPLSPFLFLICAEGFSSLLQDAESKKSIHGIKIGRNVAPISHLFFADDTLLFTRASETEADHIMDILLVYELASGQKINLEKSEVSFSRNVSTESQNMLLSKLNFQAVADHGKYLGLPTFVGRSKKTVFQTIQDRVWKKVKGWKERFLSRAGREVLLKAVAQAIPTYAMQCFKIPEGVVNSLNALCRNFWWGQQGEERKMALISWKKLCLSKEKGGVGFRDLSAFNDALLAKQCWRIVTTPDSLAARVLKGKYFPRTSFWEAKVMTNASYTWRSIVGAKELLAQGSRWIIGSGHNVRFWKDKWLPNLPGGRIFSNPPDGHHEDSVAMWYNEEGGGWRRDEIAPWVTVTELEAILKTRVSGSGSHDFLSWCHTKNGEFCVRSAYHLEMDRRNGNVGGSSGNKEKQLWKQIWGARVPQRVKHLVWRAITNSLPTRQKLAERGLQIDPQCPRCGEERESVEHLMLKCGESSLIWRASPLRIDSEMERSTPISEWCSNWLEKCLDVKAWAVTMMVMWQIWNSRNSWVFNQRKDDPRDACARALKLMEDFLDAMTRELPGPPPPNRDQQWRKPSRGLNKLNSDAAAKNGKGGLGVVVRDEEGEVLLAAGVRLEEVSSPEEAEACAILFGLQIAFDAGLRNLEVESDCLTVIKMLNGTSARNATQTIIHDILALSSSFNFCSFSFVNRVCNKVAHTMAKLSSSFDEMRVWLEDYPPELSTCVAADKVLFP